MQLIPGPHLQNRGLTGSQPASPREPEARKLGLPDKQGRPALPLGQAMMLTCWKGFPLTLGHTLPPSLRSRRAPATDHQP